MMLNVRVKCEVEYSMEMHNKNVRLGMSLIAVLKWTVYCTVRPRSRNCIKQTKTSTFIIQLVYLSSAISRRFTCRMILNLT